MLLAEALHLKLGLREDQATNIENWLEVVKIYKRFNFHGNLLGTKGRELYPRPCKETNLR
jgi:hypothetical protein